ncbi:hypothetical protein GCM10009771_23680 [Nesterenkonia flava]
MMFGMLLAFSNTSAISVVEPIAIASSAVRRNPSTRETMVPAAISAEAAAVPDFGMWDGVCVAASCVCGLRAASVAAVPSAPESSVAGCSAAVAGEGGVVVVLGFLPPWRGRYGEGVGDIS